MKLNAAARRFKKETDYICLEGQKRIQEKETEINSFPDGSWVCIDIVTGDYVVANSLEQASTQFRNRYGERLSYLHGVGVEINA